MADSPRVIVGNETAWEPFVCERWRAERVREASGLETPPYAATPGGQELVPPTFLSAQYVDAFALGIPDAPARLNGGNRCRWLEPVHVGDVLERRSTVVDAVRKEGRSGRLDIYTVETVYRRPGGAEVARLGYTPIRRYPEAGVPSPDSSRGSADALAEGAVHVFDATATSRDLVRYAVATDDLYEAHYDLRFAEDHALPGVIVHGLLKMAWLARAALEFTGGGFVREMSVSYRGMDLVSEPFAAWCLPSAREGGAHGTSRLDLVGVSAATTISTLGWVVIEEVTE